MSSESIREIVKEKYGADFYEQIGHKGGQKVKQLIEDGKRAAEAARQNKAS